MDKMLKISLLAAFAVMLFSCSDVELVNVDDETDAGIGWLAKCVESNAPSYCDDIASGEPIGGGSSSSGGGVGTLPSSSSGGTSGGVVTPGSSSGTGGGGACAPGDTPITLGYEVKQELKAGIAYKITPERGSAFRCENSNSKPATVNCKSVTFEQHNPVITLTSVGNNLNTVVLNENMMCDMTW